MLIDIQMIKRKVRGFAELRTWIRVAEPLVIICNKMIIPLAPNTDNTRFRRKKQ